jgi:CheY-like chemotaxis protein
MAHDFNNILSIILGYVNALEQADLSRDQEVKNIGSIRIAVERGAGIIRQLLTFAKKAAGDITSIRLNETITDLSRLLGETMPKGIDLAFPLTPVNPVLRADENQLQQALLNLCLNAKDAIMSKPDEKGTITIRTDVVQGAALKNRFPRSEGQQYAVIEVQDDGIGMDEEAKGRMFEPFFTTKPPGKGTGLGLAVVYGVVNAHRGFIDVESTAGEGTTVKVYLPAQSWEPASPGDLPRVNDHGGCVLLVEDEEMLLELLKTLLEENGFKVFQARDGEEAVRVYKKHRNEIDVVLSDMGLPKMGGWEAFQKMKEINPDVQSILASGYLDSGLRGEMIKAGAVDFIQKPYIPEIILERIRGIIRSKSG